jgi:hypothetical protein
MTAGAGSRVIIRFMKYVALVVLAGAVCFAEQPQERVLSPKPVCNAANKGNLWPDAANSSPDAGLALFERGELERCTLVHVTFGMKYKWERLSVNARELAKEKQNKQRSSNN